MIRIIDDMISSPLQYVYPRYALYCIIYEIALTSSILSDQGHGHVGTFPHLLQYNLSGPRTQL